MKKIVTFSGSPGSGKTTLCMNLSQTLSSMGRTVFYAHEWIKDWANREVKMIPADQFGVFGNQAALITSGMVSGAEFVTSCTSPELCAFYAEYNSGFRGRFSSLIEAAKQFDAECRAMEYETHKYFLYRSHELYRKYHKSAGRWHDIEESVQMQDKMANWLVSNFSNIQIKNDIEVYSIVAEIAQGGDR
jgi:hypothetical protein